MPAPVSLISAVMGEEQDLFSALIAFSPLPYYSSLAINIDEQSARCSDLDNCRGENSQTSFAKKYKNAIDTILRANPKYGCF